MRTLFALMLLVSVLCASLRCKLNEADKQREAVETIERLGGWVQYDCQYDDEGEFHASIDPPVPSWLRSLLGDDFFRDVVVVSLEGTNATDSDLACLKDLPNTTWLRVSRTEITNRALQQLRRLSDLEDLDLSETEIDGAGLAHLKGLRNLKVLLLYGTRVGDAGLDELQTLSKLQTLGLYNTSITDAGLIHIGKLTNLRELELSETRITDAGLVHLEALNNLKVLGICFNWLTEERVRRLQKALPYCMVWHPTACLRGNGDG